MNSTAVNILSIALIYCGTVFGAGFASGQEVAAFFSRFGQYGVFASAAAGLAFAVFGGVVCRDAKRYDLVSPGDFFAHLYPYPVSFVLELICRVFSAVSFCVMIAGCGTLFHAGFSLSPTIFAFLSLILCGKIIIGNVESLARFNAVLTPFMFLGVVSLCVCVLLFSPDKSVFYSENLLNTAFSGVLYLGCNLVSAAAVLTSAAANSKSEKTACAGGVSGGILVGISLFLMSYVLAENPGYFQADMPFFALVCDFFPQVKYLCFLILYFAMLTTAASSGVIVISENSKNTKNKNNVKSAKLKTPSRRETPARREMPARPVKNGKNRKTRAVLLYICALTASFVPFDILVNGLYRIFGLCGILVVAGILKSFLRK